ncbi:hypothetical protein C8J35_10935 [Rhizobium sp. PP-F2F-G38]|nr:hypothetical protein C8J35_10935 [Rhizobium sp. PP-F2F-G38]TCP81609.1 hypothetical protein C8J31_11255 [Rhizobium sp. PP-CC-2G-626]
MDRVIHGEVKDKGLSALHLRNDHISRATGLRQ